VIPESPRMYMLLGLNLLRLLAEVRYSEFHTELETIGSTNLKNVYINHPVQIEQALMEGSYNKIWNARADIPAKDYGFFMDILMQTIRFIGFIIDLKSRNAVKRRIYFSPFRTESLYCTLKLRMNCWHFVEKWDGM
jgi:hypothetical protein